MKIKEFIARILLIIATLLSIIITISGTLSISKNQDIIFQIIFLPVTLFFIFETIQAFSSNKSVAETVIIGKKKLIAGLLLIVISATLIKATSIFKNKQSQEKKDILSDKQESQYFVVTPTPTMATKIPQIRITTKNPQTEVNLRESPSTSSRIIRKLKRDEVYPLISSKDDWYEIEVASNSSGWVFKDYIKLEE